MIGGRRRLQATLDTQLSPPPPAPPPNAGAASAPAIGTHYVASPPPSPPPPPHSPPPSPSPYLPPPPSPPNDFSQCTCSCYTEDSSAEVTSQGAWSDIAIRARATTVSSTAVMYKAEAVLTRGRALETEPRIYVQGDTTTAAYIGRYVSSDACKAQTAHLVSGWKQDVSDGVTSRKHMLLGERTINAYMGHQPWWWPASAGGSSAYLALPESVSGPAAITFWRDVCASSCIREFDDDVEIIEVDLRRGLHDGNDVNSDGSNPATCRCFAFEDASVFDATNSTETPSHVAPGDINVLNFLSTASLVNNYIGNGTVDDGLHYRQYINTYAVHRLLWDSHFVNALQSSVYFAKAFTNGYFPDPVAVAASESVYHRAENIYDIRTCIEECTRNETNRPNMEFAWHHEDDDWCECSTTNWMHPTYDANIVYDASNVKLSVYRLKYCRGVSGGSDRSLVYNKADNTMCPGMPVGAGMILTNGSILIARNAGDFSRPFDTQCKQLCDANPDCALGHVMIETFALHNLAHALPPPPDPPTPPNPPPPRVPPLPPFPPGTPPMEETGPRVWSPGYNQAPEGSDHGSDSFFHLFCGFSESCGGFRTSIFKSASQLAVLETARKMQAQSTYLDSVCPYECQRSVLKHSVSSTNAENLKSGAGLDGEGFLYPGIGDDEYGFARFMRADTSRSGTMLHVLHMSHDVSMDECGVIVDRHKLLGPHAVWIISEATEHQKAASARLGECGIFLGARSSVDAQLWRAFYDYARFVLRLGHFDSFVDTDIKAALVHTSSEGECDSSTGTVCVWWSEFDLDDEQYS